MNNEGINKTPINLSDAFLVIEEKLKMGGEVTFKPNGTSMLPMLRPGKDSVTIKKEDKISRNDIVLYTRKNGQFVLHRVVGKRKDGYVMRGDNQWFFEKGISRQMIIGKMIAFTRNDRRIGCKNIGYRMYIALSKALWLFQIMKKVVFKIIKMIKK